MTIVFEKNSLGPDFVISPAADLNASHFLRIDFLSKSKTNPVIEGQLASNPFCNSLAFPLTIP